MGAFGSDNTAVQKTYNDQVGVQGSGVGQSGVLTGSVQAGGGGIAFNITGSKNKVKNQPQKGISKGGGGSGGMFGKGKGGGAGAASGSGDDQTGIDAGGNTNISVVSSDVEAIHSLQEITHGAIDALREATAHAADNAGRTIQAGVDLGVVAIPTQAAADIVGRPVDMMNAEYSGEAGLLEASNPKPIWKDPIFLALTALGFGLSLAAIFHRRGSE